jgi:hypothetical protein
MRPKALRGQRSLAIITARDTGCVLHRESTLAFAAQCLLTIFFLIVHLPRSLSDIPGVKSPRSIFVFPFGNSFFAFSGGSLSPSRDALAVARMKPMFFFFGTCERLGTEGQPTWRSFLAVSKQLGRTAHVKCLFLFDHPKCHCRIVLFFLNWTRTNSVSKDVYNLICTLLHYS